MRILITFALTVTLGCGSESNILGQLTPREHRETFEFIVTEARIAYDQGDLERALILSEMAYLMVPNSERAALLYGFVNLSLAGGDPYAIAKVLAKDAEARRSRQTESLDEGAGGDSSGSSDALAPLKEVIYLNDPEIQAIGVLDESDPDLPIYVPRCAEEARAILDKLRYIDSAIVAACRFVDIEARVDGDYRQQCSPYTGTKLQIDQAHFLWAFAHLTEAVAFQSILLYGSIDGKAGTSHLERRVEKIKLQTASGAAGIQGFLVSVNSLQKTLSAVMPTSGRCSDQAPTTQIRATLNDLMAVEAALVRLDGLSPDLGKSLTSALGRFKTIQADGDPSTAKTEQTKVLRQDLTKTMAKSLGEKIESIAAENGGTLPENQKSSVCEAFVNVAAGAALPPACAQEVNEQ